MSDYISREELKKEFIKSLSIKDETWLDPNEKHFMKVVDSIPLADVRENRWIPVSERLPEFYEEVLTYHEDDEEYQINWVIDDETGEWFYDNPTAWQPLPEPYKGEREDEK